MHFRGLDALLYGSILLRDLLNGEDVAKCHYRVCRLQSTARPAVHLLWDCCHLVFLCRGVVWARARHAQHLQVRAWQHAGQLRCQGKITLATLSRFGCCSLSDEKDYLTVDKPNISQHPVCLLDTISTCQDPVLATAGVVLFLCHVWQLCDHCSAQSTSQGGSGAQRQVMMTHQGPIAGNHAVCKATPYPPVMCTCSIVCLSASMHLAGWTERLSPLHLSHTTNFSLRVHSYSAASRSAKLYAICVTLQAEAD